MLVNVERFICLEIDGYFMRFLRLQRGIVYEPVFSRRLGRSLGINVLLQRCKWCSFDCVYCDYVGRSFICLM